MRYMIIVKATRDSEAGAKPTETALFARMAAYHEALGAGRRAGRRVGTAGDVQGLARRSTRRTPQHRRWTLRRNQGADRGLHDHPGEERAAGARLDRAASRTRTLDDGPWHIEVRRMFELEDFEPSNRRQSRYSASFPATASQPPRNLLDSVSAVGVRRRRCRRKRSSA